MPSIPPSTSSSPRSPLLPPGMSIWVTSPVTTALEPNPMRVRNIFICSGVVFWASSRMMKLLFSVRPRMKARGATSTRPRSSSRVVPSGSSMSDEGVVQRAEVGVDLGHEVAGQEAQPLPRLHRRPGQDDPAHLLGLQGLHGQGHGQVALARPRRADTEGDGVGGDGVGVALLPAGLGPHRAALGRPQHLGGEHLGRPLVGLHHLDRAADVGRVEGMAPLEQQHKLLEELAGPLGLVALDRDLVAADHDLGVGAEGGLDLAEELVALAEQPGHEVVAGDEDLDLSGSHGGVGDQRSGRGGHPVTDAVSRAASPGGAPREDAGAGGARYCRRSHRR